MGAEATVFVGAHPFGESDPEPLWLLERAGLVVIANPEKRKLAERELAPLVARADAWIAGTEPATREVLERAAKLRVIARVGSGLDSVDLEAARARGIAVAYTPEAPVASVAELALALLLDLARQVSRADRAIRNGSWERRTGFLLEGKTLGVLGCGRIGKRVAGLARGFGMRVLAHDLVPDGAWAREHGVSYLERDELFGTSDAITVHLPLDASTRGFVGESLLSRMKPGALLVNASRGEVLDESALERALLSGKLGGAALDVFHEEPYSGPLARLENVVLTAHMGSCTREGRLAMELGAARAVVDFLQGRPVASRVV